MPDPATPDLATPDSATPGPAAPDPGSFDHGDVRRHRRPNPFGRVWIGAGAALAVILVAVAIGLVHARSAPKAAAGASRAAAEPPPAAAGRPTAAGTRSGTPSPTPKRSATKAPAAKVPSAGTTKATGGVPAPPAGFSLTFGDSFTGSAGTGLDRGRYRYDTGPGSKFGTGEIETMTDSTRNVFHDGQGHLVLRALHSGGDPRSGWTSGRFETNAATFGAADGAVVRMQASIQQPDVSRSDGAGYWPAFWMLGNGLRNGGTWPDTGEVDILEDVNGRSSVFGTLHCGVNPGGACQESTGKGSGEKACSGCQTGFHTYAVEIDRKSSPERIRWFLDGRNYFTLSESQIDGGAWARAVDHPFFIIFDLAMGGGFPDAFGGGPNAGTVSGASMRIDYLAVYNRR